MCVYSNVGDHYRDRGGWPWSPVEPIPPSPLVPDGFAEAWREHLKKQSKDAEIDDLKKRVEVLEELLAKAKEYDAATGQPDCELDSKKDLLRKLAGELGVEINLP